MPPRKRAPRKPKEEGGDTTATGSSEASSRSARNVAPPIPPMPEVADLLEFCDARTKQPLEGLSEPQALAQIAVRDRKARTELLTEFIEERARMLAAANPTKPPPRPASLDSYSQYKPRVGQHPLDTDAAVARARTRVPSLGIPELRIRTRQRAISARQAALLGWLTQCKSYPQEKKFTKVPAALYCVVYSHARLSGAGKFACEVILLDWDCTPLLLRVYDMPDGTEQELLALMDKAFPLGHRVVLENFKLSLVGAHRHDHAVVLVRYAQVGQSAICDVLPAGRLPPVYPQARLEECDLQQRVAEAAYGSVAECPAPVAHYMNALATVVWCDRAHHSDKLLLKTLQNIAKALNDLCHYECAFGYALAATRLLPGQTKAHFLAAQALFGSGAFNAAYAMILQIPLAELSEQKPLLLLKLEIQRAIQVNFGFDVQQEVEGKSSGQRTMYVTDSVSSLMRRWAHHRSAEATHAARQYQKATKAGKSIEDLFAQARQLYIDGKLQEALVLWSSVLHALSETECPQLSPALDVLAVRVASQSCADMAKAMDVHQRSQLQADTIFDCGAACILVNADGLSAQQLWAKVVDRLLKPHPAVKSAVRKRVAQYEANDVFGSLLPTYEGAMTDMVSFDPPMQTAGSAPVSSASIWRAVPGSAANAHTVPAGSASDAEPGSKPRKKSIATRRARIDTDELD